MNCERCGTPFTPDPRSAGRSRFCGEPCRRAWENEHRRTIAKPGEGRARLLVTGGRAVVPKARELAAIRALAGSHRVIEVVHGDCRGVDRAVGVVLAAGGVKELRVPAELFGSWPACGPRRNAAMVSYVSLYGGFVVCWPGGKGTQDCVRKAWRAGLRVLSIEEVVREQQSG